MRKLIVAQILFSGLGGHAAVVFSLLAAGGKKGWNNFLLFFGNEQLRNEHAVKCGEFEARFEFVEKRPGLDLGSAMAAWRALRKSKPDLVILHSPPLLPLIWAFKLANRCKLIMVEHNANKLKSKREWLMSAWAMKLTDGIVYLTEEYRKEVQEKLGSGFVAEKVSVIPNGVDVEYFSPSVPDNQVFTISMAARFADSRDHSTLIKAFGKLHKKFPGCIRLILAGDGSTRPGIEVLVQKEGLVEGVQFVGTLDEGGVLSLLKRSNLYIHSTLHETMSTSIMQAMALGLPVIATDIEGVNNMIEDGTDGLLVPAKDVESMASAIEKLMQNKELADSLGRNARNHAVEKFSHVRMFNEYEKLVHESLKS